MRKYIGAYAAVPGGIDALVLSGAPAENWPSLRHRALQGLEFLGLRLDAARNRAAGPEGPAPLSADDAPVPDWLVPVDEERQIAHEAYALLRGGAEPG